MGIVRLAKCLRLLNSITEYSSRATDIKNKISGNRVYMDFVSIVYKIQTNVANELNYLLFSFILLKMNLLNTTELVSGKFSDMIQKYKSSIKNYGELNQIIQKLNEGITTNKHDIDQTISLVLKELSTLINDDFIESFRDSVRSENSLNHYIYQSVVEFIVDMLTNKLTNVEYVLIAFDGIPSFGKIQEQRQRRYMRYTFIEFQKIIGSVHGDGIASGMIKNDIKGARILYDNDHFQVDIRSAIDYVYSKYHSSDLQKDIAGDVMKIRESKNQGQYNKVEIDVIDKPYGEGEKILMDKVIHDYKTFGDDKTYVFYSPDGDSVILCLYIYIKTKIKSLNVVKAYTMEPSDRHNEQTQYVDSKTLYDNIVQTVEKFAKDKYDLLEDRDNICTDFIIMINFFGNDFIHQIPTMEISTTIMDLMYVYAKFIRDNEYITKKVGDEIQINYQSLKGFLKELSEFEQFTMLDTYMVDVDEKNKILKYFGNVFSCRYLLDYRDSVSDLKTEIHSKITAGESNTENIRQMISDGIDSLNKKVTVTGKKYGDIWVKIEVKNPGDYAKKILTDPEFLLVKFPRFVHNLRSRKNRDEKEIRQTIDKLEIDLVRSNKSVDLDEIFSSNDKKVRDFAFDYGNIRILVPHNQMPTTDQDIDLYLLEWKSGRWMSIMNSYSFEIGYDWRKGRPKKLDYEMKRYQYDMLELNNTNMNKMAADWLRTISWMCDYYMNTDYESTSTEISTWSFNYDRSPFITHISKFLDETSTNDMRSIMKGFYKRSLVSVDQYLKSDKHRFYIYPQTSSVIERIPQKNKINFPDMMEYVNQTIKMASNSKGKQNEQTDKKNRVFDCRMCPYFSKCIFKNKHMTFKELSNFDLNNVVEYKILKRKAPELDSEKDPKKSDSEKGNAVEKQQSTAPKIINEKSKFIVRNPKRHFDKQSNTYSATHNVDRSSHVEF